MTPTNHQLKTGYSTGTYTAALIKAGLEHYFIENLQHKVYHNINCLTPLPNGSLISITIDSIECYGDFLIVSTKKGDNDDLDVTKGARLYLLITENITSVESNISSVKHSPIEFNSENYNIRLYAGKGIGVVTKNGLKQKPGFPAINPVPLQIMTQIVDNFFKNRIQKVTLFLVLAVEKGLEIALKTANPKVGVEGGISILGTKGIVKPVSSESYIESVKSEISVASYSAVPIIVYTLGNSSFDFAKKYFNLPPECFIEIGNFLYQSFQLLSNYEFHEVYFVAGLGKMTKLSQGFKNTHHNYGTIDFALLKEWILKIKPDFSKNIHDIAFDTVNELIHYLSSFSENRNLIDKLISTICDKALQTIVSWISISNMNFRSMRRINSICIYNSSYYMSSFQFSKGK